MALLRSPLFWTGLITAAFTTWAWHDSLEMDNLASWDGARRMIRLRSSESQIEYYAADGAASGWSCGRQPLDFSEGRAPLLPAPYFREASMGEEMGTTIEGAVPYWLLEGLVLAAWIGGLTLRARRRRRFEMDAPPL